ncbi:hypothetical protein DUNSADRAFT_17499 [Dunaliella salina]|uniref:Uncharacterized protein n=1 Tax=Dunaliella salina TaxID=3046 RepID=A0ABQ7G1M5_DUNSA|nr:hypothetical protein DUNSADRAFT_17499 [Dunaliella salina]|eukprot:KAF5828502.1 hypothetical protein DUNSADRAFT_17499 [Dunaliella salina]
MDATPSAAVSTVGPDPGVLSATEALLSPFVGSAPLWSSPLAVVSRVGKAASSAVAQSDWLRAIVSSSSGADRGGLTEAFLSEELGTADEKGSVPARASNTIAWWQERQGQQRRKLEKRSGSGEVAAKGVPPRPPTNQPPALKKQGRSKKGLLGLPLWLPGMGPKPVDNNASPAELKRALAAAAAADAKEAKAAGGGITSIQFLLLLRLLVQREQKVGSAAFAAEQQQMVASLSYRSLCCCHSCRCKKSERWHYFDTVHAAAAAAAAAKGGITFKLFLLLPHLQTQSTDTSCRHKAQTQAVDTKHKHKLQTQTQAVDTKHKHKVGSTAFPC